MKTSDKCKKMMMHHEGVRFKPYLCQAKLWTIGVGSVLYPEQIKFPIFRKDGYEGILRSEYPLSPSHNRQWSKEEVMSLFEKDLIRFEQGVVRMVPASIESQGRFDALVSFSFNVGIGALQRSTIRIKSNRGDWQGAANSFKDWTKGGGKVLPGLVKRRDDEIKLFLSDFETDQE